MVVTSEFPEKGTPKTTIVCHDSAAVADQVATNKGKHFGIETDAGEDESGNKLQDIKSTPIGETLVKLCEDAGLAEPIVSDKFRVEQYDEGKAAYWQGGESFHQFLTRLARKHNAVYKLLIDPATGKDRIIFIDKVEWEKYPILTDEALLKYKGVGSIIKSINITADYGKGVGTFMASIDEEGRKVAADAKLPQSALFEGQQMQSNSPTADNPVGIAEAAHKIAPDGTSANVAISAESGPDNISGAAQSETDNGQVVSLNFTTLGFTRLTLGSAKFSGIGNRYTGFYNIRTITHTLDSNGYNCKGIATSFKNAEGGLEPPAGKKVEGDKSVTVQLTQAVAKYRKVAVDGGAN